MELQLGKFTVELAEGMGCSMKAVREKGGVTEYEFAFSWTEENAAADGFDISGRIWWLALCINGIRQIREL